MRWGFGSFSPAVLAAQDLQRLDPVACHGDRVGDAALRERALQALDIDLVVVNPEADSRSEPSLKSLSPFGHVK